MDEPGPSTSLKEAVKRYKRLRKAVAVEWKPQDLWIGVFWKTTHCQTDDGEKPLTTDIWICLLPCLPIHLTFWHKPLIKH
jgi:hypothetical protein